MKKVENNFKNYASLCPENKEIFEMGGESDRKLEKLVIKNKFKKLNKELIMF